MRLPCGIVLLSLERNLETYLQETTSIPPSAEYKKCYAHPNTSLPWHNVNLNTWLERAESCWDNYKSLDTTKKLQKPATEKMQGVCLSDRYFHSYQLPQIESPCNLISLELGKCYSALADQLAKED